MIEPAQDPESKSAWRARLLAVRRELSPTVRAEEASALARWAVGVESDPVCCYLPVGTEPGDLNLVEALAADRRVLLPIVTGAAPLDWAPYRGPSSLVSGRFGLREPVGPRLGAEAIGLAAAVLVPALAVDRRGVRLGRGGGHYDRSLPLVRPSTALIAVVRDAEVVHELPAEPHDVLMTAVLTPGGGLRHIGAEPTAPDQLDRT